MKRIADLVRGWVCSVSTVQVAWSVPDWMVAGPKAPLIEVWKAFHWLCSCSLFLSLGRGPDWQPRPDQAPPQVGPFPAPHVDA